MRIRWPKDAEFDEQETLMWCILKPDDWREQRALGWRWTADELRRERARMEEAMPSTAQKRKRREED